MQKTMLSQALSRPLSADQAVKEGEVIPSGNDAGVGAEASNAAWFRLLSGPASREGMDPLGEREEKEIRGVLEHAMRCAGEMIVTIGSLAGEPAPDLYPFEMISESLVSSPVGFRPLSAPDVRNSLLLSS